MKRIPTVSSEDVRKRLPALLVLLGAVLFAFAVTVLFRATAHGVDVPSVILPVISRTLSPTTVVFLTSFILGVFVGACYLGYRAYRDAIQERWQQYSTWAQSMIVGCCCAVVVMVLLGVAALLDHVRPSTVVLGVLVSWPLSTGLLLLQDRRRFGADSSLSSVKTGYIHTKGLESRTLSIVVGFLIAIVGSLAIRYAGRWYFGRFPLWATVFLSIGLWIGSTLLVYNRYVATTTQRTDISIVAVSTPESRPTRELSIKNRAATSVDLSESRIRDTEFDLYRLGVDLTLKPGAVCTFEIPESFSLEPNDDSLDLPLGYSLKRGGETPTLFTKTGAIYSLQWATDEVPHEVGPEDRTAADSNARSMDTAADDRSSSDRTSESDATPQESVANPSQD
ncbi:hypothetical protein [Halopiger djelfimassiliensis]|uniref:hypothetical protein n=1 Tax=Halopiger djelfimassiliensis TaxID=1293047 RepID=UPI000677C98F|nr:hypothetical protein [Halopiger djelfimassiliensis]